MFLGDAYRVRQIADGEELWRVLQLVHCKSNQPVWLQGALNLSQQKRLQPSSISHPVDSISASSSRISSTSLPQIKSSSVTDSLSSEIGKRKNG